MANSANRDAIAASSDTAFAAPLKLAIVVLLCGLVLFLDGFDTQIISYIIPALRRSWNIPQSAIGPIFSSALVGLMVGYLLVSPFSERLGHKLVLLIWTALFGLFTLATVAAGGIATLIVLRFLTGLALGAAAPSAIALTSAYAPARLRASFVLIIYCGFSLGFVAASFAAAQLLAAYGWTSLLWVGGLLPVGLTPLLWLLLPGARIAAQSRAFESDEMPAAGSISAEPGAAAPRSTFADIFSRRYLAGTVLLWLAFFVNLALFYFMQSWLPTMLEKLGYPISTIALITSLPTIGGITAAFFLGPAMDRISPYKSVASLYLLGCVFLFAVAMVFDGSSAPTLMIAIFLAGFCVSGGQKSVIALAAVFYPARLRATGVGWALGIGRLGGIAGPAVAGLLFGAGWSNRSVFYSSASAILVAAVAIMVMGVLIARAASAKTFQKTI